MWWCSLRIFLISQQTFPYPLSFCWWWHSPPQPLITLKLLLYCLCSLASLGCAKWAPPNSTCPILVCDVNWRGDWGKAQCAQNCNDKTWKMHTALRGAIRETVNKKKCFKVYFLGFKRERALRSLEEGTCFLCQTVPEYQWPLPPFSAPFIRWWRGMDPLRLKDERTSTVWITACLRDYYWVIFPAPFLAGVIRSLVPGGHSDFFEPANTRLD